MAKYRKTALIEATQFLPNKGIFPKGVLKDNTSPTGFGIFTLENTERLFEVTPGDYIATGSKGENWAIKEDIFKETYELVEN